MIQSSALEANLATYQVDVTIDDKYRVIQDALSKYYGIQEGVLTFLTELSHPHKNWGFIVKEARGYALNYFHLLAEHEAGPAAAERLVEIFIDAIGQAREETTRADATDNILLFIQKILRDAGDGLYRFLPVVDDAFRRIRTLDDTDFFRFVKSHYQIRKLAALLLKARLETSEVSKVLETSEVSELSDPPDDGLIETNRILYRYLRQTYQYFLSEADPQPWFQSEVEETDLEDRLDALFADISHERIEGLMADLAALDPDASGDLTDADRLERLLDFPGFGRIAEIYRDLPQRLYDLGRTKERGNRWKVIFLFHIMNLRGLSEAHEDALREINRTLSRLISHEKHLNVERLIRKTFSILKTRTSEFPSTALSCVFNMGKGVYKTDDSELVNFFIDSVIDLGFQSHKIGGVGNDWQIRVNPAHILNIRTWMSLIELNPRWSTRLLSTLIIHLTLEGVFIKDTDLFPRDITRLLNSRIEPVYNLTKQLAKLFPVYFNEIGAEGTLRDSSTRIDELCHRKDPLIHFLRKQTHVESSNRIVGFMEATIRFWLTRDKAHVAPFVPPSIEETIVERGPYIDGVHRVVTALSGRGVDLPAGLLSDISDARLEKMVSEIAAEDDAISAVDAERVTLAAALYRQLHQKYSLVLFESEAELDHYFSQLKSDAFPDPDKLKKAIAEPDLKSRIFAFLDYLEGLKQIIVSPTTFEIREDIYKKRHFTVDIPSMYGSYHEPKFDALGLTFRIESLLNAQFDDLIENIDLGLVTKATFFQIYDKLILFAKALRVDGISSMEFDSQIDLLIHSLEARGFTFTQYLDIFKGFARTVRNIINDNFNNIHEENLTRVLAQVPLSAIHDRFKTADVIEAGADNEDAARHAITEIFFREKISTSLGLQQLDRFLSQILNTLFHQSQKLRADHLRLLLNYDPKRAMMSIFNPRSDATGIIYLGNKGFNLVKLRNFGFPVPPGFIITTEVFRCRSIIEVYPPAQENFRDQVRDQIADLETITGKSFGDNRQPLLLSVRSGSSISQPGMMDTFLDVGISEEIAAGMAETTGNAWFAWDCYRRFIQCYGMGHGLSRDDFDAIIKTFKELWDIPLKKGFPGEMMRSVALAYKRMVEDAGIEIPEEPYEQLLSTIQLVLHSWDTPKARTYRKIMGISDDWGTAVTVQAMVFGNRSESSGTGVFFTHNPRWPGDDSIRLWGDFTIGNQGEDVVSGLVNTMPISISQQNIEMRDTDITLETHFPEIYTILKARAEDLIYKKRWSPQEIEFTFESPSPEDLYLLQTRDMAIRERKKVMTFDLEGMKDVEVLGHGIGVSGGAMSGRVVFSLDEIDHWRAEEPETPLIVLRADTVPDDIREIHSADGILTARGGLTSHAAVVAHRLGKTCVVGCGSLVCREREKTGTFEGHTVTTGDFISIDGQEGSVYLGRMPIQEN